MTFMYELNPHLLETYRMYENDVLRQGFQKLLYLKLQMIFIYELDPRLPEAKADVQI